MHLIISTKAKRLEVSNISSHKFFVYIFKDEEGAPLYIGKTIDMNKRFKQHYKNKPDLISLCSTLEIYQLKSETTMSMTEEYLIGLHKPLFNTTLLNKDRVVKGTLQAPVAVYEVFK